MKYLHLKTCSKFTYQRIACKKISKLLEISVCKSRNMSWKVVSFSTIFFLALVKCFVFVVILTKSQKNNDRNRWMFLHCSLSESTNHHQVVWNFTNHILRWRQLPPNASISLYFHKHHRFLGIIFNENYSVRKSSH